MTPGLELGVSAQNIADNVSYYPTRGNKPNLTPQIVQPGRTIMATITL